jgi:hypothetical protein
MIKQAIGRVLPPAVLSTLKNYRTLSKSFGQYRSIKRWECIDSSGEPIPWYSYPAIEYIKQLDFSEKTVFEFGSGNSSRFWANRCRSLVAVEDDETWYDKIRTQLPTNVDYRYIEDRDEYINSISGSSDPYDVVIIDGSYRLACVTPALAKLRDDGFVILDNSDWNEKASQLLRESDLIEVDMSGFGPINHYTTTTSFYFKRNVRLTPAHDRQPMHAIGGLTHREG